MNDSEKREVPAPEATQDEEKSEVTLEELDRVVGGAAPAAPTQPWTGGGGGSFGGGGASGGW